MLFSRDRHLFWVVTALLVTSCTGLNLPSSRLASLSRVRFLPPPSDPAFTLVNLANGSTAFTSAREVSVNVTSATSAGNEIARWCLSETQMTAPASANDPCLGGSGPAQLMGWTTQAPQSVTLAGTEGLKTLYLWVGNAEGTVNTGTVKKVILLDLTAPLAPVVQPGLGFSVATQAVSATFTLTGSDAGSGLSEFVCKLDQSAALPCLSPYSANALSEGPHLLTVIAKDKASNTSLGTTLSWVVDRTPPSIMINQSPSSLGNQTSATIAFSTADTGTGVASTECSTDGSAFATCASPLTLATLSEGAHTVSIRATDRALNVSPSTTVNWTIDLTAPTATITSSPAAFSASRNAAIAFQGSSDIVQFRCRLDAGNTVPCTSPVNYSGLADGAHTVTVTGIDGAGNSSAPASASWTIDATAPVITLGTTPTAPSRLTTATFTWTATDSLSGISSVTCTLDAGTAQPCAGTASYSGLSDGNHTFTVTARDQALNLTNRTFTWIVDTANPTVTITSTPTDPTLLTVASFQFSAADQGTGLAGVDCRLDSGAFGSCLSPVNYGGLSVGSHSFQVRARDNAGNVSSVASFSWLISAPANNNFQPTGQLQSANDSSVLGVASDADRPGGINVEIFVDGTLHAKVPATSGFVWNHPSFGPGAHTIRVYAMDTRTDGSETGARVELTGSPSSFTNPFARMQYYGYWHPSMFPYYDHLDEVQGKANFVSLFYDPGQFTPEYVNRLKQYGLRVNLYFHRTDEAFAMNTGGVRDAYLAAMRSQLIASDAISLLAFISPGEEWYHFNYTWAILNGLGPAERIAAIKGILESTIADVNRYFPGIPTMIVDPIWNAADWPPPANLDVLGLDPYFNDDLGPSLSPAERCGPAQKARFDANVTARYNAARSVGKPLMMVPAAFNGSSFYMPATCALQWYYDAAAAIPESIGINWFSYEFPDGGGLDACMHDSPLEKQFIFDLYQP